MHFVTQKRIDALVEAIAEANRFIDRANAALNALPDNEHLCVENAAAKRASMDLTRALANVRRNHWNAA